MRAAIVWSAILLLGLAVAMALKSGWITIPPQFSPWAHLDVGATPNFMTRYKLSRLTANPPLCQQVLATTSISYAALPDQETGPACGLRDSVSIQSIPAEVGEAFSFTCPAAVALALWERHVLQPAAQAHFGARVVRIEHFGSYACRNVYGRPTATRSQHATANALDIAGFVLQDGRRVRVLGDWSGTAAQASFLRDVRTGACAFFDGVLSPDYNAAHRDHLHLDRGPYRICR